MSYLAVLAAGHELAGTALASGSPNSSTISNVAPGLLGFLVVAALGVALVFLLRSMNKQFRKIAPPADDTAAGEPGQAPDEAQTGAGAVNGTAAAGKRPMDAGRPYDIG